MGVMKNSSLWDFVFFFCFNGVMLIKREIYGEMLGHFMGNLSGYCGNGINDVMGFCLDI